MVANVVRLGGTALLSGIDERMAKESITLVPSTMKFKVGAGAPVPCPDRRLNVAAEHLPADVRLRGFVRRFWPDDYALYSLRVNMDYWGLVRGLVQKLIPEVDGYHIEKMMQRPLFAGTQLVDDRTFPDLTFQNESTADAEANNTNDNV